MGDEIGMDKDYWDELMEEGAEMWNGPISTLERIPVHIISVLIPALTAPIWGPAWIKRWLDDFTESSEGGEDR